jgi:hypothetical protein
MSYGRANTCGTPYQTSSKLFHMQIKMWAEFRDSIAEKHLKAEFYRSQEKIFTSLAQIFIMTISRPLPNGQRWKTFLFILSLFNEHSQNKNLPSHEDTRCVGWIKIEKLNLFNDLSREFREWLKIFVMGSNLKKNCIENFINASGGRKIEIDVNDGI